MTPGSPEPVDVPEDADGRVSFLYVEAPEPPAGAPPAPEPAPLGSVARPDAIRSGWFAVAVLSVVLVAVFVAGVRLTS